MDTKGKPFVTFVNRKYPWYTWRRHRNHFYHTEIDTKVSIRILTRAAHERTLLIFEEWFCSCKSSQNSFLSRFVYTQVDFLKRKKRRKIIDKEFLCFQEFLCLHGFHGITSGVHRDKPASKKQPSLRVHKITGKLCYWFTEGDSTGACYVGIHYCFHSTQKMETGENTWRKENRRRYKSVIITNQDMSKDNKS